MSKVWKVISTVAIVALITDECRGGRGCPCIFTHKCGQYGYKILCSAPFSNYRVFGIIQEIKIMG